MISNKSIALKADNAQAYYNRGLSLSGSQNSTQYAIDDFTMAGAGQAALQADPLVARAESYAICVMDKNREAAADLDEAVQLLRPMASKAGCYAA